MALLEEEKIELQNNCSQWENEVDRLKFNAAELRRRLEDSQAALHELGRENQSLQVTRLNLIFNMRMMLCIDQVVVKLKFTFQLDGECQITGS